MEYCIMKTSADVSIYGVDNYSVMYNEGAKPPFTATWKRVTDKRFATLQEAEDELNRIVKKGDKILPRIGAK